MFSGIIEQVGVIEQMKSVEQGMRLWISSPLVVAPEGEAGVGTSDRERVGLGDSIAIFGVCLTVEEVHPPNQFVVVCGRETLHSTMLGTLTHGSRVHLERALRVGDRLDGHMVQGHADGVGTVVSMEDAGESWILWIRPPEDLNRYIAVKGSITIGGVSLTVNDIQDGCFRVNIIPYTIKETLLHTYQSGTKVNLEVDVIARYLERMLTVGAHKPQSNPSPIETQLRAWGHGASTRSGG